METRIKLISLTDERIIQFKEEMQEAFEHGFQGHIKEEHLTPSFQLCDEVCKMLNVMINKLKAKG